MKNFTGSLRKRLTAETGMILIFFTLFSGSVTFLSWKVDRGLDPDFGKDWWSLSFETRDAGALGFTIDNHSQNTRFTYTVAQGQDTLDFGTVDIPKGSERTILPSALSDSTKRATITVEAADGKKKSIYR